MSEKKLNTVLNKKGYILKKEELNKNQIEMIENDLTVEPFQLSDFTFFSQNKNKFIKVYRESKTEFCLPKYYGIEKFGNPSIDKLNSKKLENINFEFRAELRDYQKKIMKDFLEKFKQSKGGIFTIGCGGGKTHIAIYLMCYLKLKTLIITHAEFLENQIIDRITNNTNINEIGGFGSIYGKTIDTNHPIVMATVQSLSMKDYDEKIFSDFGLVIIDETHHMGGRTFHKAFYKINSPYMLGLTATPRRSDGMFKVIHWYIGPQLYYEEQAPNPEVQCKIIKFSCKKENENFQEYYLRGSDKINRSKMITNLTCIKSRNNTIVELIKYMMKENGRKILVLSGRIDHLKTLEIKLNNADDTITTGLYIGELKKRDLDISATKQVIFASYQMAAEGLDIDALNTLILATPISDIQQSIGRILRKQAGTYDVIPVIIDIVDNLNVFLGQSRKRKKYYDSKEYQYVEYKIYDVDGLNLEEKINKISFEPIIKKIIKEKKENTCMFLEDDEDEL